MKSLSYQRIVIKLSGEAFKGAGGIIDHRRLLLIVKEIKQLRKMGVAIAVVVGAGNIWRKRNHEKVLTDVAADYLGLLATVMNGLALKDILTKNKISTVLQSPVANDLPGVLPIDPVAARGSLRRGEVVIFAGGTGKPFYTTDTAAALRAYEVRAPVIIKTGPADGVYSSDPKKNSRAKKINELTFGQAARLRLKVMDQESYRLCLHHKLEVVVCRWQSGAIIKVVQGKKLGSIVRP